MGELKIKYAIEAADYAEANALVAKRSFGRWDFWSLLGSAALLLLLPLAGRGGDDSWRYPFLVVPFAAFLIYCALFYVFPEWNARRYYSYTNLANTSFTARFSTDRVDVEGQHVTWSVEWAGFRLVRESSRLFLFYDGFTMFIFAKRYFTPEEISMLQKLIGECWKPALTTQTR
jgi:hypothetical protein